MLIGDRNNDLDMAKTALHQIQAAYETARSSGDEELSTYFEAQSAEARAIRDRLTPDAKP